MAEPSQEIPVYLEVGKKRVLAGAVDWPGWCRGGRDEASALQALVEYAPRYKSALQAGGITFHAPDDVSALKVVERVEGNTTTDFGAPDVPPSVDDEPVSAADLRRLQDILEACWSALNGAEQAAYGKELRLGPRGGGRALDGVIDHVRNAEASYLSRLGGKLPKNISASAQHQVILDTLAIAARGEVPPQGPRGGARWTPRYFVRRAAWHVLDHVWEIEDRVL